MPTFRAVALSLADEQVIAVFTVWLGDAELKFQATLQTTLPRLGEQLHRLTMRALDLELGVIELGWQIRASDFDRIGSRLETNHKRHTDGDKPEHAYSHEKGLLILPTILLNVNAKPDHHAPG